MGHIQVQEHQSWLLCGEDSYFMWLNEFPPTLPDAAPDAPEMGSDGPEPDVPMTPIPTTDSEVDAIAPNSATDDTEMDDGSLTAQAKSATPGDGK